ncbi:MAG: bestrophin-like domain [Alphaproteobacteria bacterium]
MLDAIYNATLNLPDLLILGVAAVVFGAVGGLISLFSYRLWFQRWSKHSNFEDRLAETAHDSFIAIIAFVLALSIANEFDNYSKAKEMVRQEALEISRIQREFVAIGPSTEDARRSLKAYAESVVSDEWPSLARRPSDLSQVTQGRLNELWRSVRAVQRALGEPSENVRFDLSEYMMKLEEDRESRLGAAKNLIPTVFWTTMILFAIGESFLSGRRSVRRFGIQINVMHMSAIGLLMALILIFDNPFRGETSVSPQIILDALKK